MSKQLLIIVALVGAYVLYLMTRPARGIIGPITPIHTGPSINITPTTINTTAPSPQPPGSVPVPSPTAGPFRDTLFQVVPIDAPDTLDVLIAPAKPSVYA